MTLLGNYYEVYDRGGANEEVTKHFYADIGGAKRRVAFLKGNALYYLHPDHLNSTAVITDDAGQKVGDIKYYPYGSTRSTSGTLPTDRRFTGQRLEATLGLYDFNARYYDPQIGRFIQADTVMPEPFGYLYSASPSVLERGPSSA